MSNNSSQTHSADAFTRIILEIFRFNGQLITSGDGLTKPFGLTSALWQVLGAVGDVPLSVAQIARNMGLTRQSVRRSANLLKEKGFIRLEDNPNHQRAKLLMLTEQGSRVLKQVKISQIEWSNRVTQGLDGAELENAIQTLKTLDDRLQ